MAFSFSGFLLPGHDDKVFAAIQPFVQGEVATMLWLVIMGAKAKPWPQHPDP